MVAALNDGLFGSKIPCGPVHTFDTLPLPVLGRFGRVCEEVRTTGLKTPQIRLGNDILMETHSIKVLDQMQRGGGGCITMSRHGVGAHPKDLLGRWRASEDTPPLD